MSAVHLLSGSTISDRNSRMPGSPNGASCPNPRSCPDTASSAMTNLSNSIPRGFILPPQGGVRQAIWRQSPVAQGALQQFRVIQWIICRNVKLQTTCGLHAGWTPTAHHLSRRMAFVRAGISASFAGLIWVSRHCAAATGDLCNLYGLEERRCELLGWELRI